MQTISENSELLALIEANKGIIFKICNLYCADKNDREDLAQEIIYNLWKSGKSFSGNFKFSTWMYRVALNVAISFYRKGKLQNNTIPLNTAHQDIEDGGNDTQAEKEQLALLHRHIQKLNEFDRALILLHFEEKGYKEISEILGISETNVATKLSRIKERLTQNILNHKN